MTDHPEWQIPCPWCRAPAGQRCTGHRGQRLQIPSHDARTQAWNQAVRNQQTGEPE